MYDQLILENWANLLFNPFCGSLLCNYCLEYCKQIICQEFFQLPIFTRILFSAIFVTGKPIQ